MEIGPGLKVIGCLSLLILLAVISGCTNVREVETLNHLEEPLNQFIGEGEAIQAVANTREVIQFRRSTAAPCLIQVEQHPTAKEPVYIIRVVEDQHDHLVLYDRYSVDAYSGNIID
ncbi:MAG: hypothetical protein ACM3UW_02745 [Bacillota bacterium]